LCACALFFANGDKDKDSGFWLEQTKTVEAAVNSGSIQAATLANAFAVTVSGDEVGEQPASELAANMAVELGVRELHRSPGSKQHRPSDTFSAGNAARVTSGSFSRQPCSRLKNRAQRAQHPAHSRGNVAFKRGTEGELTYERFPRKAREKTKWFGDDIFQAMPPDALGKATAARQDRMPTCRYYCLILLAFDWNLLPPSCSITLCLDEL
jgi:hypothetical protein